MISILIREFYPILNQIILNFDFILSSDDVITDNEVSRQKLNEIIDTICKMCHHIYRRRPTCAELLSEYNQWGITGDDIKKLFDFSENLNQVQNSDNTFFNNYLTTKLKLQNDI